MVTIRLKADLSDPRPTGVDVDHWCATAAIGEHVRAETRGRTPALALAALARQLGEIIEGAEARATRAAP